MDIKTYSEITAVVIPCVRIRVCVHPTEIPSYVEVVEIVAEINSAPNCPSFIRKTKFESHVETESAKHYRSEIPRLTRGGDITQRIDARIGTHPRDKVGASRNLIPPGRGRQVACYCVRLRGAMIKMMRRARTLLERMIIKGSALNQK